MTATRITYSIICSFIGLGKAATRFVLHVFCLLLCKICSPRNSDVFRSSQNQIRKWQGKNSAMALSAISWTRGDKDAADNWIPTNDSKQSCGTGGDLEGAKVYRGKFSRRTFA